MANYDEVFDNMSIADMRPISVDVPSNTPSADAHRPVDINAQPGARTFIPREGTIAGHQSSRLLDQKDHFPVITETQARASMSRSMQLSDTPAWYRGTLDELRYEVYQGIVAAHPELKLKVPVPVQDVVIALSDGEDGSETKRSDLKNPEDIVKTFVPQEKRPSIAAYTPEALGRIFANISESDSARQAFASDLVEMLTKQKEGIEQAMTVAERLLNKGLSAEEFSNLIVFLQEDILRHMLMTGTVAGAEADRRAELMAQVKKGKKPY